MSDQEQLSTEQEREYVEAAWEEESWGVKRQIDENDADYWVWHCGNSGWRGQYQSKDKAIRAASLYTKEHKGELKRRRYAISLLKLIYAQGGQGEWKPVDWKQDQEALEQVIAREQAALADLLRGWREKGDGK